VGRLDLRERIKQGVFVLDGAMGTQLFLRGIEPGAGTAAANVNSPEVVRQVHRAYFEAGSDAVLTNTFEGSRYALARHGLADNVRRINAAAARIAREAAGEDKYVLGDIGPSGDFLEPLGSLKATDLRDAFAEQAAALLEGQVDGFVVETMSALEEIEVAVEAVKSLGGDSAVVFASMAFDAVGDDFRTMMGVDVEAAVAKLSSVGVDAMGFNCGRMSLEDYVALAERFASAAKDRDCVLLAELNAGQPELVDSRSEYNVTPAQFVWAVQKVCAAGVRIVGGCCGTGPEHIEAVVRAMKK